MMNEGKKMVSNHHLILENRQKLHLTGVADVDNFDDKTVAVRLTDCSLTVRGEQLHMGHLDIDHGELEIDGRITALIYGDASVKKEGKMLGKLFR